MTSTIFGFAAGWLVCAAVVCTPAIGAPEASQPDAVSAVAAATAPAPSTTVTQQLAAKLPELVLNKVLLDDAVRQLRAATQANVVVDWASLKEADVTETKTRVSATLRDVPFAEALNAVLADAGNGKLTYLATGDIIWVLSKQAVPRKTAALNAWAKREVADAAVEKLLDRRLPEMKVDSVPLSDVIDAIRDLTNANIAVNWKALEAAGVKRNAPTSYRLRDVKLADMLLIVVESVPAEKPLKLSVADGVIQIDVAPAPK